MTTLRVGQQVVLTKLRGDDAGTGLELGMRGELRAEPWGECAGEVDQSAPRVYFYALRRAEWVEVDQLELVP